MAADLILALIFRCSEQVDIQFKLYTMCGVAGFLHFENERHASISVLKRMTDAIVHRGPDGEGYYVKQNLALGHRRLSIIDLGTGAQPMFSEDRQIVLVFNGEIYNFLELKEELTRCGCKFTTASDTEVILHAYRTWGLDCQNHFNGMWAFALWDESLKRLFISRDRIGEKPLYHSVFDNTFIFGSEIKALLAYGIQARPRLDLTELYLTLSFIPAPYTFHENIDQLLPGKYLLIDRYGVKEETYWTFPRVSEKELIQDKRLIERQFEELFYDSVKIRMRSDVAFGAFLSGGLDSSCVVSAMASHASKPVQTFTVGFKNLHFDERSLAQLIADKYQTDHHVGVVSPVQFEEALKKIVLHYDDPFGDESAIPTGYISELAAQHVKMVLTGDGGDEVLSGYTIYQGEIFAKQYQRIPLAIRNLFPPAIRLSAKPFRGRVRYRLNRVAKILESSGQPFERRLHAKLCNTSLKNIAQLVPYDAKSISFFEFYEDVMKDCLFNDPFYKLMYFQHKVTLPGDMLTKVDRMSMAYSIETRIPFLDYRIVELLFRVNKNIKTSGFVNKMILRNAVANKALPKELLSAPKKGFAVPLRDWFKENDLIRQVQNLLFTKNRATITTSLIDNIIRENNEGKADAGSFIWTVLVLKKWFDTIENKAGEKRSYSCQEVTN